MDEIRKEEDLNMVSGGSDNERPAPKYRVGQLVLVRSWEYMGPFTIYHIVRYSRKDGWVYKLNNYEHHADPELPESYLIPV